MNIFVSITFDDGNESQFTEYYPILERYGFRATFYVITSLIGKRGMLTYDQLKELYNHGNEIGSHTHTHPYLTKIPVASLIFELKKSKDILENFKCSTLAYPYGDYNEKVIYYVRHFYSAARGYGNYGINSSKDINRYALKVISQGTFLHHVSDFHNGLAIFVFHGRSNITFDKILWAARNKRLDSFFNSINYFLKISKGNNHHDHLLQFKKLCELLSADDSVQVLTVSEALRQLRSISS
jgi:peptidoglycan/xylan/chitin deacetylase (PgdA/CDA1 family)